MPILSTFCQKFDQEKFCSKEESLEITALQIKASQWSITTNRRPLTTHIYHVMIIVTGGFSLKSFLFFPRNSFKRYWTCFLGI